MDIGCPDLAVKLGYGATWLFLGVEAPYLELDLAAMRPYQDAAAVLYQKVDFVATWRCQDAVVV